MPSTLGFTRVKAIHSVGVVQQVAFRPLEGTGYTGIFESGSDFGLMRYSVAQAYDDQAWGENSSYNPGLSMKWFRDGEHSANLMALQSFIPTINPNFFLDPFTNHLKKDGIRTNAQKALAKIFSMGSHWALTLGTLDWA